MTVKYDGMPPQRVIARVLDRLDRSGGPGACWPCAGAALPRGYVQIGWTTDGRDVSDYAHRIVLMHALGRRLLVDEEARHTCDNPPCGNPLHLVVGSHALNMRDMVDRNRSTRGERHPAARLTEADVRSIRSDARPVREIAEGYGVTPALIYAIRNKSVWTHLLKEIEA